MIPQPRPLIEVVSDIPDVRTSRGKRHPCSALLALSCCAMLCGSRRSRAIAAWGRHYGSAIAHALGFTQNTPWASTLHTLFGR
jgi:DDE_Tnp_1-associated